MFRISLAVLLLLAVLAPAAVAGAGDPGTPRIVAVVPNPALPEDRGEYLLLSLPAPTDLGGLRLADGESAARLPNRTMNGTVAATTDPAAVRNRTDHPVIALSGRLALANDGETVRLLAGNRTVDAVRYADAPEAHEYVRSGGGWRWRRLGATDVPVRTVRDVPIRAFALPDAPSVPLEALAGARERVLLAGYTFTSERVGETLCALRGRGVAVRVLLDGEPVGGMTRREARRLDALAGCGIPVTLVAGEAARYAFHHAKYAVVDDRALVLTENWKPAGVGGRSSRGWGVIVESPAVADALASVFRADAGWRDGRRWRAVRRGREFENASPPSTARYPSRFEPRRTVADRVDVLVAPDNAEAATVDLLASATESIRVLQVSIGSRRHPFVRALLRAARRGVRVRVLLSGAWYVAGENRALADRLNGLAGREGLPLAVRVADPRSRFGKVHAKGVVVDGDRVAVGSANWNNVSLRENREVVIVLRGDAVGAYYARIFRADWRGGAWRLPVGVGAASLAAAALAVRSGLRAVRFDPGGSDVGA